MARDRVRLPGRDRLDRAPGADRARARWRRRATRRHGARPGARRRGACRRGRAAPGRARTPHRRARGDEPRRPRPWLVARPRRGLRGLRPGAARPPALRPCRNPPRRRKRRCGDGDRRHRGRGISRPRHRHPRRGLDPRAGDRRGPHGLSGGHLRPALPRGGGPARARNAVTRPGAASARAQGNRGARDLAHRARGLPRRGGRARDAPGPARRDRGPEPAGPRGRARGRGRAPPPIRLARRLRLARLARAAQPDGGRDRLGPNLAAALARAEPRPAGSVSRRDRERDDAALRPRRRRARHLEDRGRHVRLRLLGRRSRRDRARFGRGRGDRSGRGVTLARTADDAASRPRRRQPARGS